MISSPQRNPGSRWTADDVEIGDGRTSMRGEFYGLILFPLPHLPPSTFAKISMAYNLKSDFIYKFKCKSIIISHSVAWTLRVSYHRLAFSVLFARAGQGKKKRGSSHAMGWRGGLKKLASFWASVRAFHPPGWDSRDEECRWLETLRYNAKSSLGERMLYDLCRTIVPWK